MSFLPELQLQSMPLEIQVSLAASLADKSVPELRALALQLAQQVYCYQATVGTLTKAIAQADFAALGCTDNETAQEPPRLDRSKDQPYQELLAEVVRLRCLLEDVGKLAGKGRAA